MTEGVFQFGDFVLDDAARTLRRNGEVREIGSRYFDALCLLVRHPDELITKDRFMAEVWSGVPVTDEALTQCIRTLRRTLGDNAGKPRYIQTVPKHGYRFVADVRAGERQLPPQGQDRRTGHIVAATTLGGAFSGLLGGLAYGVLATTGGAGSVLSLILLTVALSVIGAAAIGAGMGVALLVRPRSLPALLGGGTLGGFSVGAVGQALGASGLLAITGVAPGPSTGMVEGAGLGLACAVSLGLTRRRDLRVVTAILAAALIGGLVMGVLSYAGAHSFAETLAMVELRFPASQLRIRHLLTQFGSPLFAISEGVLFAASITAANLYARHRSPQI